MQNESIDDIIKIIVSYVTVCGVLMIGDIVCDLHDVQERLSQIRATREFVVAWGESTQGSYSGEPEVIRRRLNKREKNLELVEAALLDPNLSEREKALAEISVEVENCKQREIDVTDGSVVVCRIKLRLYEF